jgi:hypothetical protein
MPRCMACGINLEKDITIKNVDPDMIDLEAIVKEHGESIRINGLCLEHFAEYLNKLADAKKKGKNYNEIIFVLENYPNPKPIIEYDDVRQLAVKIATKYVTQRDNRSLEWGTTPHDIVIYGDGKEEELIFDADIVADRLEEIVKLLRSINYSIRDETKRAIIKEAVERLTVMLASLIKYYGIDEMLQKQS